MEIFRPTVYLFTKPLWGATMVRRFFLLTALLFLFVNLSYAQDYMVGEGDVLTITVYDHPDLTTTTRVGGEGTIFFPLIGNMKVSGLTISRISVEISKLLADGYIINPQVTVFIQEFRSRKATIMGQVNKPGLYELHGFTTFLELLSKAGGLTNDAGDRAIIKRNSKSSGKSENIVIDLQSLIKLGNTSLDIPITDGDGIYISKAGVFYITGEVKKPAAYKYEEDTTVIKALTMAGGLTAKASDGRIKIIRTIDDKETVLEKVKMDEPVLPDDIIVVPESFF